MDYIIVKEPEFVTKILPNFGPINGWNIVLYDQYEDKNFNVFLISKSNSDLALSALGATIEQLRLQAIQNKKSRNSYIYWKKYYQLIESFATPINLFYDNRVVKKKSFDYGYASTVHKSQGSSYDNIFVDIKNIKTCKDDLVRRQLQYVALSRTRKDAFVLQ